MAVYDRIFAGFYDHILEETERAGLAERRHALLAQAGGRVLELGAGTGLNLEHYPEQLERLVLTEPSPAMGVKLRERLAAAGRTAEVVAAPAEDLPFEDGSFDTVVATLVLCTVPDLPAALAEIRRVLSPDGQLLLIEHVRSDDPARAKWQDRLERPYRIVGRGCRCNRETERLVEESGFQFSAIEHGKMRKAFPIVRPLIEGRAVPVGAAR
jgi:ubiquinone/menaquinone biosynthesis C-methylase UbiE